MAYTNYELEAEAFDGRPELKKTVQDLLCHAADAHKNMIKCLAEKNILNI